MTKTEYIKKMYTILVPMCARHGYHNVAAGMIAQSIQEGWNSGLASKYYNYWGMKAGDKYPGETVAMDNKQKTDPATYRVYHSMEQGCEGYFEFLRYPRYNALKDCTTDTDYLDKIGPCGWNANKGYGNRCKSHLPEVYAALGTSQQYIIGQTYTTQQDLNVRDAPDGELKSYDDLTDDGKQHALINTSGYAILKRNTKVTVRDISIKGSTTWLQIPSGWICGKNSKNVYVM